MKTAIEQLISEFEELKKTKLYGTSFKGLDDCINLAYAKLELEKQQIIDAVNSQKQLGWDEKGQEYYEQTFKK
jgi:hypothetical protein